MSRPRTSIHPAKTRRAATVRRASTTTRTATRRRDAEPGAPGATAPARLVAPQLAHSSESGITYRLDEMIGKGGFGEVYLATPVAGPTRAVPSPVCVKITTNITTWLREAYFAQLLERQPRALRVYDRFAEPEGRGMRYCLTMEYAEHGDLGAWLTQHGGQDERFVRREIAAILAPLDALHRGQGLHRDLTPFNVFVCGDGQLKLGDFGIATHQLSRKGVTAEAFNPMGAPTEIAWGKVRKWQQRDDIYQVGMLLAMLLRGDVSSPMRSKDVRTLPCSDELKEVIHRCLGARTRRYETAAELIEALRQRPAAVPTGRVKELKGRRVAFTGFLSRPRSEAMEAARRAGAVVQSSPGPTTDVLVRGRPNKQQIAGAAGGTKLLEVKRLAARGHQIAVIGEQAFWSLVEKGGRGAGKRR